MHGRMFPGCIPEEEAAPTHPWRASHAGHPQSSQIARGKGEKTTSYSTPGREGPSEAAVITMGPPLSRIPGCFYPPVPGRVGGSGLSAQVQLKHQILKSCSTQGLRTKGSLCSGCAKALGCLSGQGEFPIFLPLWELKGVFL